MNEKVSGAITYSLGFMASGVSAGIKTHGEDISLIFSKSPASAAGVFTQLVVKAAPVVISQERVPSDSIRAVIVNSGNANAITGERGIKDALDMTALTAHMLNIPEKSVLVASTGITGQHLPMDNIISGIKEAALSLSDTGGESAALGILTTDTRPKEATAYFSFNDRTVRIGGMAKGSGMICPNMATMLGFITTDAAVAPGILQKCLERSVEISFNCLTVDGDTSTNDTLILLANGASGCDIIDSEGPELDEFQAALDKVTISLAKQLAADGEGATKLIEITVQGVGSFEDARQIAKTIANSPLVKTAIFGCDPNWGRILAAAGRAGVNFDPEAVCLFLGNIELLHNGEPVDFPKDEAHDLLCKPDVGILLNLGDGSGSATVWTCDLSYDYVKINAEYHT